MSLAALILLAPAVTAPADELDFGLFGRVSATSLVLQARGDWGSQAPADFLDQLGPVTTREAEDQWTWTAEAGLILLEYVELGLAARHYTVTSSATLASAPDLFQHQETTVTSLLGVLHLRTPELHRGRLRTSFGWGPYFTELTRRGYLEDSHTEETIHGCRLDWGGSLRLWRGLTVGLDVGFDVMDLPSTESLMPVEGGHEGDVTYVQFNLTYEWAL